MKKDRKTMVWFYIEKNLTTGETIAFSQETTKEGWVNDIKNYRQQERKEHIIKGSIKSIRILPEGYQCDKFFYDEAILDTGETIRTWSYSNYDILPSSEWRARGDITTTITTYKF